MGLPCTGLPDDELPQCWSDDVRMNALFAPFRLKSANPESWDMKMKFWSDMVRQWCKYKMDPMISAADVKCAFQRRGRTAACIDIVIEEMYKNGELSPLSKYQQILHNGPEGWVKWGARLAFRPAAFALTAVSYMLPAKQAIDNDGLPKATIDSTQRFVLESAVKEQATALLDNYPPGVDRVGTVDDLIRHSGWQGSRDTFEVLLGYLVCQGAAVKKGDVVKLAEPNKRASPVTEMDEALVKLSVAEARLEADATRLARDVANADTEARAALALGNRLAAKNHLRRKLKAQQRADRCEAALDNVRQLLLQTREAGDNTTLVDTYRTSAQAMKNNAKEGGLEVDMVHDTMDDLKEVMENYNEVEKALGGVIDDNDAAELEQELADLLASPGAPSGGTPGKEDRVRGVQPSPRRGKVSEREFVFDGEEQMLAALNQLSVDDAMPERPRQPVAVAEALPVPKQKVERPSKPWYPPSSECLQSEKPWTNLDTSLDKIAEGYGEVRQDERIHPGQPLNVDFNNAARHYSTEFQVRDHRAAAGVWLYNTSDTRDRDLAASTDYTSSSSPGKGASTFEMAPGGERKPKSETTVEDLELRLQKLRGLNL